MPHRVFRRVAALYDIHGNLPALEAVLARVVAAAVDLVVLGGDVAPGPLSSASMDLLRTLDVPVVGLRGNGDNDVLAAARGTVPARVPASFQAVMLWSAASLSPVDLAEMAAWADTVEVICPGLGRVLFCHATPRDDNEIFTVRTPSERVEAAFVGVEASLVVCGHTHMPFDRTLRACRVVNAGSVGMPFGDTAAQWLLLDRDGVQPQRTEYDLERAAARIRTAGYPLEFDPASPPDTDTMIETLEAAAL